MGDKITAIMATIPLRGHNLRISLGSILPQVDNAKVVLNGYKYVPKWLTVQRKVSCDIDTEGEGMANAVWRFASSLKGYVFIIDDDIVYPSDYVQRMLALLKENDNKVVACVHGKWVQLPFRDMTKSLGLNHFKQANAVIGKADIAGVGTVAYHTDAINPTLADINYPWFRDLQFSAYVARQGVKILRVVRDRDWLRSLVTNDLSLCDRVLRDGKLTEFANNYIKRCILPHLGV